MRTTKKQGSQAGKTSILVLGAPGSGSSAMASILGRLGCELAKDTPTGGAPSKIEQLNDRLLASAGSSPDDFTPFYEGWMHSPRAPEFLDEAVSLLGEQFGDARLFVLEDSRICRLLPFWLEALSRFEATPTPVFVNRNPAELAGHMAAGASVNEALGQMVWLRQMLDAERQTRSITRFYTSFERLVGAWAEVAQSMQDRLGIVWPAPIANAEFEASDLLNGLRNLEEPSVSSSIALPEWLGDTYEIFERWVAGERASSDLAILDRIRSEFDVASNAFGRVVRAERGSQVDKQPRRSTAGKSHSGAGTSDLQALNSQLQEARRNATLLTADVQREIEARETVEFHLVEANAEVAASRERRKEMARVIANREAKIDQLNQELEARYQELAKLQRHILRFNPVWMTKAAFRRVARAGRT